MIVLDIIGMFVVAGLLALGLQWISQNVSFKKRR